MTMKEATYWEYCSRCNDQTPHRFLYRQGLHWTYQCKKCGHRTTIGPQYHPHVPFQPGNLSQP